jgi:hypothetical protein
VATTLGLLVALESLLHAPMANAESRIAMMASGSQYRGICLTSGE